MIVAITGTPGVGKTRVLSEPVFSGYGYEIVSVEELATEHWAISGKELKEIDVDLLASRIEKTERIVLLDGHLSHYLKPDMCIVLRCHPKDLEERLKERDYEPEKVRENVEAEAIDLVLVEAVELNQKVYEIDNTNMAPEKTAKIIMDITSGNIGKDDYKPGSVNWSEVILEWY